MVDLIAKLQNDEDVIKQIFKTKNFKDYLYDNDKAHRNDFVINGSLDILFNDSLVYDEYYNELKALAQGFIQNIERHTLLLDYFDKDSLAYDLTNSLIKENWIVENDTILSLFSLYEKIYALLAQVKDKGHFIHIKDKDGQWIFKYEVLPLTNENIITGYKKTITD